MPQEIIPVAAWMPDMPDLAEATSIALNVLPITPQSYGPMQSIMSYGTSAMEGPCIGAFGCQGNDLTSYLFAGTADNLYQFKQVSSEIMDDSAGNVMTDSAGNPMLTGVGSYVTGWVDISSEPYSTAPGDNWSFTLFNDSVVATNFGDVLQSFGLGSSTAFGPLFTGTAWVEDTAYSDVGGYIIANGNRYTLVTPGTSALTGTGPSGTGSGIADGSCVWNYQGGPPPQARRICAPKSFVMVGNTFDPVGGLGPQRVWWSGAGDATTWPAPGSDAAITVQSDFNDFEGNFGEISGMVDSLANADVAIFFRRAVWRGLYVGPPDIFDFFPTENVRGCPAPNSIVALGAVVWYLAEDGFYGFDGATSQPIGDDKFDVWFYANVNQYYLDSVVGAANIDNRLVLWAFPSVGSQSGVCDSILAYRWDIGRASYIYAGPNAIEWMMRMVSFGISLDAFVSIGFTDLDTIPASLDSAQWVGGASTFGVINGANQLAYFSGPNMAAQVATQTKQLTPGRRSFVQSARPLVDLTEGAPTVAFAARVNLYDTETFGAAVPPDASGECPQRSDGRYHNAMIAIPAGAVWTHIIGADVTFVPGGFR